MVVLYLQQNECLKMKTIKTIKDGIGVHLVWTGPNLQNNSHCALLEMSFVWLGKKNKVMCQDNPCVQYLIS